MRAAWRHEQLSVRMPLAAAQHHSAPKCAGPEKHEAPRGQTTARAATGAQLFCLDLDEAPVAGSSRPDRLPEIRPQERVQRHTVDLIVAAPLLDVHVPLVEEQLVDASALAFLEEAEATVRYGFMSSRPLSGRGKSFSGGTCSARRVVGGRRKRRGRNVFLDLLVLACHALLGSTVVTCSCLGPGGFLGRFPHFFCVKVDFGS